VRRRRRRHRLLGLPQPTTMRQRQVACTRVYVQTACTSTVPACLSMPVRACTPLCVRVFLSTSLIARPPGFLPACLPDCMPACLALSLCL
jgi:hypothetical protein